MKKNAQKIVLSASRDIPFNKLVLSQSNVRRIRCGVSIEELAEDIAHRSLLQSLNVRAMVDESGLETGFYEIPAGGRRYRALERLVKQKRMAKDQPVPCIVREGGFAEEDSLAENTHREALHPLDQFRAFQTLKDSGLDDDEIAARFFVTAAVVRQRLKLASASPTLLAVYEAGEMPLEQLMAFCVSDDHARQEEVWNSLRGSWNLQPYTIRRMLTEKAVSASDPRALFVGLENYQAAGGVIVRDLFEDDRGGWLQDPALLERLAEARLQQEAEAIGAEGWQWVSVAIEFPWNHTRGLDTIDGTPSAFSEEEAAALEAARAEFDTLQHQYEDADELPDEVDARLGELERVIEEFDARPLIYDPADIGRAGAFVSIDEHGGLLVERGYLKGADADEEEAEGKDGTVISLASRQEEKVAKSLPDRVVAELTAWRTVALRDALAQAPDVALLSLLHVLCLKAFYRHAPVSCLEIRADSASFQSIAPELESAAPCMEIAARHEGWRERLPAQPENLWDALQLLDGADCMALLAHVVSCSVTVVCPGEGREPASMNHGHQLARAVGLDLTAAGWRPTAASYFGQVSKARILDAVREGKDDRSAGQIDHLKKDKMASEAERLLADTGWLPVPLRTPPAPAASSDTPDVIAA